MKKTFVIVAMGLLLLVASCDTKNIGPDVISRGPQVSVTVPADMNGMVAYAWVASWIGGTGPYTISWDFGGGAANIPIGAGVSPVTSNVMMNDNNTGADLNFTYTVTVTDSQGLSGTASASYVLGITLNMSPTIDSMVIAGNTLTVTVSDGDDDPVTVSVSNHAGMSADSASKVADGAGVATFSFTADDMLVGASTTIDVSADDGAGGVTTATSGTMTIDPFAPDADSLYALPQSSSAGIGDLVTVLVYTGATGSWQFMLGVGLIVPDDGTYESGTFNVGAVGGARDDADGVWADITNDGGFALGPDVLIIPGPNPDDSLGANNRFDFNISPLIIGTAPVDMDLASVTGALFNLQFSFSSAGTKVFDFQAVNGVNRTYYADATNAVDTFWGTFVSGSVDIN